ncbi:MAG: TetR family transcriptional regulator [Bacteroidales bacterium]|nr:TetR family transcriptional regulator [Bacteroidota bacterium]MCF8347178.1 TetR family transcriptional regulator [Bacteroidales bacterium]
MAINELNTEDKILDAANSTFLLYGYHGTTLQQIANKAAVNKAAIHYYFRSKERLYVKVVNNVINDILKTKNGLISNQEIIEQQRWFLYTEMYNNKMLFESTLIELYANERNAIRNDIRVLLETKKEF